MFNPLKVIEKVENAAHWWRYVAESTEQALFQGFFEAEWVLSGCSVGFDGEDLLRGGGSTQLLPESVCGYNGEFDASF